MKNTATWASLTVAALAIAGCNGLSDVGDQKGETAPPIADAMVLNHAFSKDGAGNLTTQVRAGTEVFLTGKDSDGVAAPVLRFEWCQLSQGRCLEAAQALALIVRNNHTVSFTAPSVVQDTTLRFRLTVTDAKGQTASKDVEVMVAAMPDGDHFLSYGLDDQRQVRLAAVGSQSVQSAVLASDVAFTIEVRRSVDYVRVGGGAQRLELGTQSYSGTWLAAQGVGTDCDDPRNPSFHMQMPAIDMDDILAKIGSDASMEPDPARVDAFHLDLEIAIRLDQGSLPSGVAPLVCADRLAAPSSAPALAGLTRGQTRFKRTDPATNRLTLTLEELLGAASSTLDTPASAAAYYATIDPQGERTSLRDWLVINGFIPAGTQMFTWAQLTDASSAHAIYTNNFDLGFGRDMYARIVRCDDGAPPALGQPLPQSRIGQCDIAAVVINYASLEAATKSQNPVLAVAMEYSMPRNAARRIVQFYTFAPNVATGNFDRVASANLDGRGEKYMPQVCTVCHGGTPRGLASEGVYANGGDVNATFLPWDADSFLFADAQGSGADRTYTDDSLKHLYTRDAQAEQMRRLNQLAYLTYHDATRPNRFILPRQLIEGWYGTQGANAFANSAFKGDFVPAGWSVNGVDGTANTADDNPADAPTLYHDVFARNCRACHIAHEPSASASGAHLQTITATNAAGTRTFDTCDARVEPAATNGPAEPSSIGESHQIPMSCYRQFFNAPSLPQRLSNGEMPFARLTMDRLWVPGSGTSAGDVLFAHLTREFQAAGDAARLSALKRPGTPEACFVGISGELVKGAAYPLDASCSKFPREFVWTLTAPEGSSASILRADTPFPVLQGVDRKGTYQVKLSVGPGAELPRDYQRQDAPIQLPQIGPTEIAPVELNTPVEGSSTRLLTIDAAGGEPPLNLASVSSSSPQALQVAQVGSSGTTVRITGLQVTATPVQVTYTVVDSDNLSAVDRATGTFSVKVTTDLAASSFAVSPPVCSAPLLTPVPPATLPPECAQPRQINIGTLAPVDGHGQTLLYSISTAESLTDRSSPTTSPEDRIVLQNTATGEVLYTPPRGRMSQFRQTPNGPTIRFTSSQRPDDVREDRFSYTVRYLNDESSAETRDVSVPLQGTPETHVRFADLHSQLQSTCAGCHTSGPGPSWFSTNANTTFCKIASYINRSSPASSLFYTKPGDPNVVHNGSTTNKFSVASLIRSWIEEGAYNTEIALQDVPADCE